MCIFCFFLTADEYRAAINGFNLDQSIAIRIGALIDDDSIVDRSEMMVGATTRFVIGLPCDRRAEMILIRPRLHEGGDIGRNLQ